MAILRMARYYRVHDYAGAWQDVVNDFEERKEYYTFFLLCSQPEYVLESLIKNSIMYDTTADDPSEANDLEAWILTEMEVSDYAGAYIQMWTQGSEPHIDTAAEGIVARNNTNKSRFLSANQIEWMIKKMAIYSDRAHQDNTDLVNSVSQVSGRLDYHSLHWPRLWRKLRKLYVENIPEELKDIPYVRTMTEVGQAYRIFPRLKNHREHRSDNNTVGLCGSLFKIRDCIEPVLD
ncbi:hypothetical protein MMC10_000920 [Thelotrema lepadinum]|nr:hypothetical protein [Thelotrema lepadinum]